MEKKVVSPIVLFFIAVIVLIVIFQVTSTKDNEYIIRVVVALAASAISISIPGMLKIGYGDSERNQITTLAEKKPEIVATGAIAVFVLVYLFNTVN